jgi:plastocyanin
MAPTTVAGIILGSVALVAFSTGRPVGTSTTEKATTPSVAFKPVVKAHVVTVTGKDFKFDAPDEIPAGLTEFRFLNKGPSIHHMQILKLTNGKTFADLRTALARQGPPPAWMKEVGGPNAPAPGTESNATLMMQPGNYAIICFVDIGGAPHFTKGMVRPLKVVAASGPAASNPTPDVTATLFDYNFRLSTPIVAGTHTIKVVNNGTQPHEIELVQLAPGKTANDFLTWAGGGMKGPPPARPIGGVAGLERGMAQSFTANFTPGNYAFICFIPDAKDGKPHFMHGMTKDFSVR